jgi:NF-kappa-B inhibitor-like protein 2
VDIVKLLLDKGAAINDRGGTQCQGVTPLHDAAFNGHLSVMQLLLDRGANAFAKTDTGETILEYLKVWRSKVQLDFESEHVYESLAEQMSQALDKAGAASITNDSHEQTVKLSSPTKDLRRSALVGLEDEDNSSPPLDHAFDYRSVMLGLRRKSDGKSKISPKTGVSKRSALVSAEDMVDDWLEDDVGKSYKKRKSNSPAKSHSSRKSTEEVVTLNDSFEDLDLSNGLESQHNSASLSCLPSTSADVNRGNQIQDSNKLARRKRPQQTKLTSFGHLRTVVEAASRVSPKNNKRGSFDSAPKVALPRTSSFESAQHVMEPTLSVDVRIDKKLYRVPVLLAQVTTNTIKWLADEAAARYAKKEYMIPSLELETKNGAILADDDPISLLFPMGATQAEEVEARVVKWSVPPLIDRYRGACQDMSTKPCDRVCQMLQQLTVNLNLCNCGLRGATLAPLCKVLNRQTNLLELDLSGNFLTNECVQLLGASLASLENLHKLRLNCTGLLAEHVQTLVNSLSPDTSHKVTDVDLSDNLLGDQSLEGLALLTRRFQLKKFNLSGNRLGKNLFAHRELTLNLDQVEEFDLSDNDLSNDALVRIVSWLRPSRLRSLDVSRNCASCGFLREMVSSWSRVEQLKVLKLSRCHVNDGDLFDLLRLVVGARVGKS